MGAVLRFFSINADDVNRARRFYEAAFGWRYAPWGPPDFYITESASPIMAGALQARRELEPGKRMRGLEVTAGVSDVLATAKAVEAAGGRIVMPPVGLDGVGRLIYFADLDGNYMGACQYDNPPAPFEPAGARVAHFAINAAEVGRAKTFYEAVFGWRFEPWGQPDFLQTDDAGRGAGVAIHGRRELKPGAAMLGLEATISVESLAAAIAAISAAGGKVLSGIHHIPTVGQLVHFEDTEGNLLAAMSYDAGHSDAAEAT